MEKNVIKLQGITKKYKEFAAVRDVSLNIQKGDIYGLVGKNGAGKTTLFKMILGLSRPTEGTVSINDSKTSQELLDQRGKVGFLIGSNFYDYLNAHDNIEYYRRLKGIKDKNETQRVLEIVGLDGVKKPFKAYSMGMKQRLGIANAILGNPEVVILDEPINGLDPQGILDVRNLILLLNEKYGMTLVVSSHILNELDLIATRFGIIDAGLMIKEDAKQDFESGSVVLKTGDNKQAQTVIAEVLHLEAVIGKDDVLMIQSDDVDTSAVIIELVKANIRIYEVYQQKQTLEDKYFELTGGVSSHA